MLRGTMEVLTDSASKEMIWQEGDTTVSYTHLDVYKRQSLYYATASGRSDS